MGARDTAKSEEAVAEIKMQTKFDQIYSHNLDLGSR